MKRRLSLMLVIILMVLACAGCMSSEYETSDEPQEIKPSKAGGTVYEELSDNFVFVIYPTKLLIKNGQKNIAYDFEVINNSEKDFKSLFATVVMNENLDQYLAAGAVPLEYTGVDVAAKSRQDLKSDECKGVALTLNQLLTDEQFMDDAGLDYKDIEELGKDFEILVKWNGGEERYKFTEPVVNELD